MNPLTLPSTLVHVKRALAILLSATAFSPLAAQKAAEAFEAKTFQDGDFTLHYRIHVPKDLPPDTKIPLVLFLHGAGERGDNNIRQLHHGIPSLLAYIKKNHIPAILLAPQCPVGMQWVAVPWGGDAHTMPDSPTPALQAVQKLLAQTMTEFPVDPSRVYLTGISMGGFGTWDFLQRNPELFAAALPICGGGDTAQAAKLTSIPIWTFHGGKDTTVKTQRSRDMVEAVKTAGGTLIQYTEYPEVAHNSWTQTYNNDEVLDWLFSQKKTALEPTALPPSGGHSATGNSSAP